MNPGQPLILFETMPVPSVRSLSVSCVVAFGLLGPSLAQGPAVLVADINPGAAGSSPNVLVDAEGTLFFRANDGSHGNELWRSDGTAAGTIMVRDANPGTGSASVNFLTAVGPRVFYAGSDGTTGPELFTSDGTAAGTRLVRRIEPSGIGSQIQGFVEMDGIVYFTAFPQALGSELWRTDGTAVGTWMVRDIAFGSGSSILFGRAPYLVPINGTLWFGASDGGDIELWKSNGTAASTVRVHDINPSGSSQPRNFTALGSFVYFSCNHGSHGLELWRTDGTAVGTTLVLDINPGASASTPDNLVVFNNAIYFFAADAGNGRELWKTDGTPAGTMLVLDIWPGVDGSSPANLVVANDRLFFRADDGVHGRELWTSDGTPSGTVMVADLNPGSAHGMTTSSPLLAVGQGRLVFFSGDDGASGLEPWVSDGTVAGTRSLGDVNPGIAGSAPTSPCLAGNHLFFAADDGAHGSEPWAVPMSSLGVPVVQTFGQGCPGLGGIRPRIGSSGLPRVGVTNFQVTLTDIPTALGTRAVLLAGIDRGLQDLGGGCWLRVPWPAATYWRNVFSSPVRQTLAIPGNAALVGIEFFFQWGVNDQGGILGTVTLSDALRIVIGS